MARQRSGCFRGIALGVRHCDVHELSKLFAAQDGLATLTQLEEREVTDGFRRQRLQTGEWERFGREMDALGKLLGE